MMRHYIALFMALVAYTSNVTAQDDDMYFASSRRQTPARTVTTPVTTTPIYDIDTDEVVDYRNNSFDVDAYNRRNVAVAPIDTMSVEDDIDNLMSRIYNTGYRDGYSEGFADGDDYVLSTRMYRFRYPNVWSTFYDPWYYDSWSYDPWYNNLGWNTSIYWRAGRWGWSIGFHPSWYYGWYGYRHYYTYYPGHVHHSHLYGHRHNYVAGRIANRPSHRGGRTYTFRPQHNTYRHGNHGGNYHRPTGTRGTVVRDRHSNGSSRGNRDGVRGGSTRGGNRGGETVRGGSTRGGNRGGEAVRGGSTRGGNRGGEAVRGGSTRGGNRGTVNRDAGSRSGGSNHGTTRHSDGSSRSGGSFGGGHSGGSTRSSGGFGGGHSGGSSRGGGGHSGGGGRGGRR